MPVPGPWMIYRLRPCYSRMLLFSFSYPRLSKLLQSSLLKVHQYPCIFNILYSYIICLSIFIFIIRCFVFKKLYCSYIRTISFVWYTNFGVFFICAWYNSIRKPIFISRDYTLLEGHMIKYHPHLLSMLTDAGYSQKDMRKYKLISQSSLQSIREGKPLSLSTINVICNLLDCQPGDILRFELTEDDRRFLEDKLRIYYDYGDQPADKS